jgi:hypothetical protein
MYKRQQYQPNGMLIYTKFDTNQEKILLVTDVTDVGGTVLKPISQKCVMRLQSELKLVTVGASGGRAFWSMVKQTFVYRVYTNSRGITSSEKFSVLIFQQHDKVYQFC